MSLMARWVEPRTRQILRQIETTCKEEVEQRAVRSWETYLLSNRTDPLGHLESVPEHQFLFWRRSQPQLGCDRIGVLLPLDLGVSRVGQEDLRGSKRI